MPLGYVRRRHVDEALAGLDEAHRQASQLALLLGTALLHHDEWCGHSADAPGHPSYHEAIEAWQHWLAFGKLP